MACLKACAELLTILVDEALQVVLPGCARGSPPAIELSDPLDKVVLKCLFRSRQHVAMNLKVAVKVSFSLGVIDQACHPSLRQHVTFTRFWLRFLASYSVYFLG